MEWKREGSDNVNKGKNIKEFKIRETLEIMTAEIIQDKKTH